MPLLFPNSIFLDDSLEFELLHPDQGESLVIQRVLSMAPSKSIDDDSCENAVSTYMVEKLALKTVDHPEPYQFTWLKKRNAIKVNQGSRSNHYNEGKIDAGDTNVDATGTRDNLPPLKEFRPEIQLLASSGEVSKRYKVGRRLRKLRPDEAWATIERLAQYEDEVWNDTFILVEMSLNYENPDIEQLLGIMERNFDTLIKDAISLMERSKSIFQMTTNEISYKGVKGKGKRGRKPDKKIKKITKYPDMEVSVPLAKHEISEYPMKKRYDPQNLGTTFRLGVNKGICLFLSLDVELPTIRDGSFNIGNTKVKSIRDLKVRLAHRCIATTILGRKESTNRVTKVDLYYLYCIYTNKFICNIPYWLAKYLKSVRDKNLICGWMFVTKITQMFGVLICELMNALSVEPPPRVFKKKSLIVIGVIIELHNRGCCWPTIREAEVKEEDEGGDGRDEAFGG
nr:hypothetical protein [Tanacetum cinerariifolium]